MDEEEESYLIKQQKDKQDPDIGESAREESVLRQATGQQRLKDDPVILPTAKDTLEQQLKPDPEIPPYE